MQNELLHYYKPVCEEVGKICNAKQIASLTSFTFNVGVGAFRRSTLLQVIKRTPGDYNAIENQFKRWSYAGGKQLRGLLNRRIDEFKLYVS